MAIKLAVLGSSGKMGQRVVRLAQENKNFQVVENLSACDVAIDFTAPAATSAHLVAALKYNKPLVIGTTGHSEKERKEIEEAAKHIPILISANFSLGISLCLNVVEQLGRALFGQANINISETHHVHKKDTPSGTALALAAAVGKEKGKDITIESVRQGEVIGEHSVIFECGLERIEVKHTAHSRDAFARGALQATQFLIGQAPGLYSLKDINNN